MRVGTVVECVHCGELVAVFHHCNWSDEAFQVVGGAVLIHSSIRKSRDPAMIR